MKLYSDHLSRLDLADAAHVARVGYETLEDLPRVRLRLRGFKISLTGSSPHPRNSGHYGAYTSSPPATWDEHGEWMAHLFRVDPDAIIGPYRGAADFHQATRGAYA